MGAVGGAVGAVIGEGSIVTGDNKQQLKRYTNVKYGEFLWVLLVVANSSGQADSGTVLLAEIAGPNTAGGVDICMSCVKCDV